LESGEEAGVFGLVKLMEGLYDHKVFGGGWISSDLKGCLFIGEIGDVRKFVDTAFGGLEFGEVIDVNVSPTHHELVGVGG
jgi:hypothetical protein